mgnify:CR=1
MVLIYPRYSIGYWNRKSSKIIEKELQKVVSALNEKLALRSFAIVQAINSLRRLQFFYADIWQFVNISDILLHRYGECDTAVAVSV